MSAPSASARFNPAIKSMHKNDEPDLLYHLGLDTGMDLSLFHSLRFVVMCGSASRSEMLAFKLAEELPNLKGKGKLQVLRVGKTERYSAFMVGSVLCVNHGMGAPSVSILLHELFKLCHAVGVLDTVKFLRLGTCGGVGIGAGVVSVTDEALNAELQPGWRCVELGKVTQFPSSSDPEMASALMKAGEDIGIPMSMGKTVTTDDFFDGQGRMDGAFTPWYTHEQRQEFFAKLDKMGVRNMEMECGAVLAFCKRAGVPAACVALSLHDVSEGDEMHISKEGLASISSNGIKVVTKYLKDQLGGAALGLPSSKKMEN